MRAINHALTGTVIGLVVADPIIAIPAAVVSHYVCDAIPHYDAMPPNPSQAAKQRWIRSRAFRRLLYADALLCLILVLVLAVRRPEHWLLAAVCAFAAAAPDFLWLPRFLSRVKQPKAPKGFNKFAGWIQWFQRPIGSVVEIAWFVAGVIVIAQFLR